MKHTHISPRVIERINTARRESAPASRHTVRSHAAKAASMGLMYGGKLQDQVNQLRNSDFALIERRIMAYMR